jgi:hypothetical protein
MCPRTPHPQARTHSATARTTPTHHAMQYGNGGGGGVVNEDVKRTNEERQSASRRTKASAANEPSAKPTWHIMACGTCGCAGTAEAEGAERNAQLGRRGI